MLAMNYILLTPICKSLPMLDALTKIAFAVVLRPCANQPDNNYDDDSNSIDSDDSDVASSVEFSDSNDYAFLMDMIYAIPRSVMQIDITVKLDSSSRFWRQPVSRTIDWARIAAHLDRSVFADLSRIIFRLHVDDTGVDWGDDIEQSVKHHFTGFNVSKNDGMLFTIYLPSYV